MMWVHTNRRVIHKFVLRSERGAAGSYDSCSCALWLRAHKEGRLMDWSTLLDLCMSSTAHVLCSLGLVPWTHLRRSGLQVHVRQVGPGFPRGASRTRRGGAARTLPGGATCRASQRCYPRVSWRCHLHAPSPLPARVLLVPHPPSWSLARRQRGSRLHRHLGRLMEDILAMVSTRAPGNVSCRMLHCSCCGATRQHFHVFEQMNRSVISECCCWRNTQLKGFHSLIFRHWKIMISLISDVNVQDHARTRITNTVEHHTVFRNQNGRKSTDCVVLTMALVNNPFHICLLCWSSSINNLCGTVLPTVFVIFWLETPIAIFFTMASITLFWIDPCVAIFSIPSVA